MYKATRTFEFAYSHSSTSVSALPSLPSQAFIHPAELAEQIEELRASVRLECSKAISPWQLVCITPRPAFYSCPPLSRLSEEVKQRCLLNGDVSIASAQATASTPAACQARTNSKCRNEGLVKIFVIPLF